MVKKDNNLIIVIIIVGALILGLMYFGIIPNLFVISSYTEYSGSCPEILTNATYGAVANECYLLDSIVMKVNSVQTINSEASTVCRIDVSEASTGSCLNNKVYTSQGKFNYCDSHAECGGNVCLNHVCTNQPLVECSSFSYSNWSSCGSNGERTRAVISSYPTGCYSGSPILSENCTYVATSCTDSNWQATISSCVNNIKTTTYTKIGECVGTKAPTTQACTTTTTTTTTNTTNQTTSGTTPPGSEFLDKYMWWIVGGIAIVGIFFLLKK